MYLGRYTYDLVLNPSTFNVLDAPRRIDDSNVVGSLRPDGLHSPVLDIDLSAGLVPSSTEGHSHLYIDGVRLTWRQYKRLLRALAKAGVISWGYYRHSVRQRQTVVRLPWKLKDDADYYDYESEGRLWW